MTTKYAEMTGEQRAKLHADKPHEYIDAALEFFHEKSKSQIMTPDQIRAEVTKMLAADKGNKQRPSMSDEAKPKGYSPAAAGAPLDGKWKTSGEFLRAIAPSVQRAHGIDPRLLEQKDINGITGSEGGFLIPEEFRAELMQMPLEAAIVRPRATVIPMPRGNVTIPAIRDASHATSVFGGVWAYRVQAGSQGGVPTETQPTFAQIKLDATKLMAYTEVDNEVLNDSAIALEALINTMFPQAISYVEDLDFLTGSGVGEPLGAFNGANPSLVSVTRTTASTIKFDDIINMYSRLLPLSIGSSVWLTSPNSFPQLAKMAIAVGTGGAPAYLPANGLSETPYGTLMGRPLIISEKMTAMGTAGDIGLADFRFYYIGDTQGIMAMASPHFKFSSDQTVYRWTLRNDGRPSLLTALTPQNGSTDTLSAFVRLAT